MNLDFKLDFKRNLGPLDRVFRSILGVFLVSFAYSRVIPMPSYASWLFYLAGLSQVVEGTTGY